MNQNQLRLFVGSKIYAGWKDVRVSLGIEQIAGTYELTITERWPNQPTDWTIPPGEVCEIKIGEDAVISGYVDTVAVSYDSTSHSIKVTGRDRTGDLVDCSAPSVSLSGLSFLKIAQKLCQPFGISVSDQTDGISGKVIPKLTIQNGESVFKTLEKLARSVGVLLISDARGGLLITRAGMAGLCKTPLEQGENILKGQLEHTHASLYSEIVVKGQSAAPGASKYSLADNQHKGEVKRGRTNKSSNSQIDRYRPLILVAETQADAKRCQQRAEWEASNREAKARRITLTVQGWRQPDGTLWQINQKVRVCSSWLRTDECWLVAGITFSLSDAGSITTLTLTSDKAFDLLPEIPKAQGTAKNKYTL